MSTDELRISQAWPPSSLSQPAEWHRHLSCSQARNPGVILSNSSLLPPLLSTLTHQWPNPSLFPPKVSSRICHSPPFQPPGQQGQAAEATSRPSALACSKNTYHLIAFPFWSFQALFQPEASLILLRCKSNHAVPLYYHGGLAYVFLSHHHSVLLVPLGGPALSYYFCSICHCSPCL